MNACTHLQSRVSARVIHTPMSAPREGSDHPSAIDFGFGNCPEIVPSISHNDSVAHTNAHSPGMMAKRPVTL